MLGILISRAMAEEAVPTAEPNWFQRTFEKFGELPDTVYIVLVALIALGIGLFVVGCQKGKWTAKMIAFAAICIALSFVLGQIRLYKAPYGGSVTPASMLPIMLFSYAFGPAPGILAGVVYGLLDFLTTSSPITNVWSFALDYIVGFGVIGLVGVFRNKGTWGLYAGESLACVARFTASLLSGVLFYAEYTPVGMNPWVYSTLYNGGYMLPELAICVVLSIFVAPRVLKVMKRA